MEYLSQNKFAQLAGVSNAAIIRARKEGRIFKSARGIDPTHPTNKHYLENARGRQGQKKEVKRKPAGRKGHKPRGKSKAEKKRGNGKGKDNTPDYQPPGIIIDQLPDMPLDPENGHTDDPAIQEAIRITKTDADTWKRIEEIKKLQLARQEKRKELVPRVMVQRVFNRLYMIDVNQFRSLGDRVSPEIASLCGAAEQETILQINKIIEREIFKTLKHVQRLLDEFLKSINTNLEAEQGELTAGRSGQGKTEEDRSNANNKI